MREREGERERARVCVRETDPPLGRVKADIDRDFEYRTKREGEREREIGALR